MTLNTITQTFDGVAVQHMQCWCGISFAIPETLYAYYKRQNERQPGSFSLHCPMGHTMIPAGRSEADKLRDQLATEKAWRERAEVRAKDARLALEHTERRLRGTKSVVTRMKRRTAAGRCPCCSHQFKDLERHMKAQHPKWDPQRAAEEVATKAPPTKKAAE